MTARKITDEKSAEDILKGYCSECPADFEVMSVAIDSGNGTYFIDFVDKADQDAYDAAIADAGKAQAIEAAYAREIPHKYAAVWFNEDLDPACELLSAMEIKLLKQDKSKKLVRVFSKR